MYQKTVISSLDPYAIKDMEFNVKRVKKYTTFKSILASLIILVISFAFNYSSISNIWIDISQLPITLVQKTLTENEPFTDTPVCFRKEDNSSLFYVYGYHGANNVSIPQILDTQVRTKFPYMMKYLQGYQFTCFNLKGFRLTYYHPRLDSNNTYYLGINFNFQFIINVTNITIFIKTNTVDQTINGQNATVINETYFASPKTTDPTIPAIQKRIFRFKQIQFTLYNSLLISYQPEVIRGIQPFNSIFSSGSYIIRPNQVNFLMTDLFKYQSILFDPTFSEYTVVRENIGQILGKFFAWYSLFLLIFIVLIAPVVQFGLNIELVKSRYNHQYLNGLQPSIFIQIKYYISRIFPSLFKERILCKAFEKLERDMNIINLLKLQLMMRRISKQLKFSQSTVQLFVPEFEDDGKIDKQLLERQDQQSNKAVIKSQFVVEEQEDNSYWICKKLMSLLESFDASQVQIGLVYNKGNQYGSIWSVFLTICTIGGIVAFFIVGGVLTVNESQSFESIYSDIDGTGNVSMTIRKQDLFFAISKLSSSQVIQVYVTLLNQKYQILKNVTFKNGTDCQPIVKVHYPNVTVNESFYCLGQDVQVTNFQNNSEINLKFGSFNNRSSTRVTSPTFRLQAFTRQVLFIGQTYQNFTSDRLLSLRSIGQFVYTLQPFLYQNQITNQISQGWTMNPSVPGNTTQTGNLFKIAPKIKKIKIQSDSIWDVIDNAWGLLILCFEIIIFRVNKYINLKVKKAQTNENKQIQRGNIVNILANHDRLIHGTFRKQLNDIKFYFKETLKLSEI